MRFEYKNTQIQTFFLRCVLLCYSKHAVNSAEEPTTILTARLPEPLIEQLRMIAKAEGRSLSSQVRIFLSRAVTQQNTARPAEHPGHPAAA